MLSRNPGTDVPRMFQIKCITQIKRLENYPSTELNSAKIAALHKLNLSKSQNDIKF